MADDEKKERFGRYLILDHLVDGGMAKICRARFLGEQADKVVAIKMVQPQFSKDESFKIMFMDEIKLTFSLLHPNIVQTYDYGVHNEQLFVAMEYCDGRNLKEYLDKLRKRKFVFPVEISAYIITQVCQGIHYAHTLTDKLTGKDASIIHRDISPHNVMLTYDGSVKIIDFGIAKSETNSEATQAGTIKGKLSYLAPEYLEGLDLDPRYDEFAIGITLWEMLCSRKLFKAKNDLAVLRQIQECKIPAPSSINPNVPKELDEIVLKALSKDRTKRYDNCDMLNRALMKFLYANYPDFNATDLSYFAKELFKEEIKKDREKLFQYGKIDLRPYLDDLQREQNGHRNTGSSEGGDESVGIKKAQILDFGFEEDQSKSINNKKDNLDMSLDAKGSSSKEVEKTNSHRKSSQTLTRKKINNITQKKNNDSDSTLRRKRPIKKATKDDSDEFDKKKITAAAVAVLLFMTLIGGGVFWWLDSGEKPNPLAIDKKMDERTPSSDESTLEEEESAFIVDTKGSSKFGKVTLRGLNKAKHHVFVNGKKVSPDFLKEIKIPRDKKVSIRIEMNGMLPQVINNFIYGESGTSIDIDIEIAIGIGHLKIDKDRCKVKGQLEYRLLGELRIVHLPLKKGSFIRLPTDVDENGAFFPKKYGGKNGNFYLQREGENFKKVIKEFTISDGASVDLCNLI